MGVRGVGALCFGMAPSSMREGAGGGMRCRSAMFGEEDDLVLGSPKLPGLYRPAMGPRSSANSILLALLLF